MPLINLEPIVRALVLGVSLLAASSGALLLAAWFSLVIWSFHDIRLRSNDVFTQLMATLMVAVLFVPGALLYTLLRPSETLGAIRERRLIEGALSPQEEEPQFICPACEHPVEQRWMVCPHCLYQLREPCPQCGELMELDWRSCAYCGRLSGERQPVAAALPAPMHASPAYALTADRAVIVLAHSNGNGSGARSMSLSDADRALYTPTPVSSSPA